MSLLCPYICENKNEYGYCKTTVCINQKFNQINAVVVCPVCKQERRQGEMMLGVEKPICAYCYKKKGGEG